jgi:hypothetical protein
MNATHKKKLAALILERANAHDFVWLTDKMDLSMIDRTLEILARNGLEAVVRHRSRQGEHYYNRRRHPSHRVGEARFKYDPVPSEQGKIHVLVATFYRAWEPHDQNYWKQVWVALDKETATKALVLGYFPTPAGCLGTAGK